MSKAQIWVIGGGQLAWMMGLEAPKIDVDIVVQTPQATDPAVATATDYVLAAIADAAGTKTLSDRCSVLTFENEFVDLAALAPLADQGVQFRPTLAALAPLLDKYTQRQFLAAHNLPNPPFVTLDVTVADEAVATIAAPIGFPLVMKTRRLGYDGQGTFMIATAAELLNTWRRIERQPVLLEAFIPLRKNWPSWWPGPPPGKLRCIPWWKPSKWLRSVDGLWPLPKFPPQCNSRWRRSPAP